MFKGIDVKKFILSIVIGIIATLILLAAAFGFDELGYPDVSRAIFWQNSVLQSLVPLHNIGTAEKPIYEGTPLNILAFYVSIPFGFLIYSILAYVLINRKKHT